MAEPMDTSEVTAKKLYVLACEKDRDVEEIGQLKSLCQSLGYVVEFSYDTNPDCRPETEFDKVGKECEKFLFIVSEDSLSDRYIEFCRKRVASDSKKCLVHLVISRSIKISDETATEGSAKCMDEVDVIAGLPIEMRVFPVITVREKKWLDKLSKYLVNDPKCGCPPVGKIAPGLCCSYVQGYLEMVLDGYEDMIMKWQNENKIERDAKMVKKMINLIPKSCECNEFDSENLKPEDKKVECRKKYLDTQDRNFDMPVYRVQNPNKQDDVYYVVLIQNATVHTLYEMRHDGVIDHDTMIRERSLFETQLADMMQNRPINIVTFNDDLIAKDEFYLTNLIIEKCQEIIQMEL